MIENQDRNRIIGKFLNSKKRQLLEILANFGLRIVKQKHFSKKLINYLQQFGKYILISKIPTNSSLSIMVQPIPFVGVLELTDKIIESKNMQNIPPLMHFVKDI